MASRQLLDTSLVQTPFGDAVPLNDIAPILEADPELGDRLSPDDFDAARRALVARVVTLDVGTWKPERSWSREEHPTLGLLVLDGLMTREVVVAGRPSSELLGAGD